MWKISSTQPNASAPTTAGVASAQDQQQTSGDQSSGDRSSVILAPARLDLTAASSTSTTTTPTDSAGGNAQPSVATNKPNNYFSNNFGPKPESTSPPILAESRLSHNTNTAPNKLLLRPSVLRFAPDSSTSKTDSNSQPKENKTFAFVSLDKEDIARPATTLIQPDSIIRCGADTTSPFNGEEAPGNGAVGQSSVGHTSVVTSTSSATPDDTSNNGVQSDDSNSQTGFVFGQNLAERAVVRKQSRQVAPDSSPHKKMRTDNESDEGLENGSKSSAEPTTSSASNETSVIKTNSDGVLDLSSTGSSDSTPEKKESHKRKFEVITGEEDEQNVLSMHCRLYAWETDTSSWKEKGSGCLRLNDAIKDDKLCSRIVMRTSGALRVILNAHLVSGMRFDMSNERCLRFINVDGIYLIKGAAKDIDQLNSAIDYRLREISKRHKKCDEDDTESVDESLTSTTPTPPPHTKPLLQYQKTSIEELSNDSAL